MSTKLMIVDDDSSVAKNCARAGTEAGFSVRIVTQPAEALDAFIEFRPDILLLDMMMPEKDGIEVLNEVLLTGIPVQVIAISGHGEAYFRLALDIVKFHDAAPIRVLRKPVRKAELVRFLVETAAAVETV